MPPEAHTKTTRSSLACLPCRSRHLKCDGQKPKCTRCTEFGKPCHYAQSRRGGLDRAALEERRKRLAAADKTTNSSNEAPILSTSDSTSASAQVSPGIPAHSRQRCPVTPGPGPGPGPVPGTFTPGHYYGILAPLNGTGTGDGSTTGTTSPGTPPLHVEDIERDALVKLYYEHFHAFHPLVVPRRHLLRLYQDPSRTTTLGPLVAVLRFVGHLYGSKEWSHAHQGVVDDCVAQAQTRDAFMVQCLLLYSVALFWSGYQPEAQERIRSAAQLAIDLGMFRQEFAVENGAGDPVLEESWRRTWWMVYIVEAYYAGTLGARSFTTVHSEATVDLPCEEAEYESGSIPIPKSLDDFECREFAPDDEKFSSFAYLIGAVRCAGLAIAASPELADREASIRVIGAADSAADGWLLLLPKKGKEVLKKTGEIDELMFQAHLLVHVTTIGIHRPFSDLKFSPVEEVSSCARERPPDTPTPTLINVHTVRVLRAVEAQIRLLALPARPFHHTPFTTCMVSEGTLALLSACSFLLEGKELAVARDQIRLTIGCLRALGETWARTARNVKEIQTIARHVLGLQKRTANEVTAEPLPRSDEVPSLSGGEGQGTTSGSEGDLSRDGGGLPPVNIMDPSCGWYSLSDLGPDFSWWMNNEAGFES